MHWWCYCPHITPIALWDEDHTPEPQQKVASQSTERGMRQAKKQTTEIGWVHEKAITVDSQGSFHWWHDRKHWVSLFLRGEGSKSYVVVSSKEGKLGINATDSRDIVECTSDLWEKESYRRTVEGCSEGFFSLWPLCLLSVQEGTSLCDRKAKSYVCLE